MTKNEYAQAIAELTCKRFFRTKGYNNLPAKFWSDNRFARDFKLQMIQAYALLKIYDGRAILNALNSKEGLTTYSLRAKWLDPIIAREEDKLKIAERQLEEYIEKKEQKEEIPAVALQKNREAFQPKQSTLDKLD